MRVLSVLLWASLLAAAAPAQPTSNLPGSVLLFPYYNADTNRGPVTVFAIANTNASRVVGRNNFRAGDVNLHFYYVNGRTCRYANKVAFLTPNDIETVVAQEHNPGGGQGYLLVVAEDPETGKAINFNYLIGTAIYVDLPNNRLWSVPAVSFQGRATGPARDRNGRPFTDARLNGGNGNGSVDFDGREYDFYPDELYIGQFVEEKCHVRGQLYLVSGLGTDWRLELSFLFYDNEEDVYSQTFRFMCWTCVNFQDISKVTRQLNGDPKEFPSGWARIDGVRGVNVLTGKFWRNEQRGGSADPPFLGFFTQRVDGPNLMTSRLLHWRGRQNGNEFPPDPSDD